jgi:hypothetical protein
MVSSGQFISIKQLAQMMHRRKMLKIDMVAVQNGKCLKPVSLSSLHAHTSLSD